MGATLYNGVLTTNRTRATKHPASGDIDAPLFRYADPIPLSLVGLELELTSDGNGWSGAIHGEMRAGTYSDPPEFPVVHAIYDTSPTDGKITEDEFLGSSFTKNLLMPDVQLFGANDRFSPSPCIPASTACATATRPASTAAAAARTPVPSVVSPLPAATHRAATTCAAAP